MPTMQTSDGKTVRFVERDTDEWARMWDALAEHPVNMESDEPTVAECLCCGSSWQYMGTFDEQHQFRHHHHPLTGTRMVVNVPAVGGAL